jgi:hypothetical protein
MKQWGKAKQLFTSLFVLQLIVACLGAQASNASTQTLSGNENGKYLTSKNLFPANASDPSNAYPVDVIGNQSIGSTLSVNIDNWDQGFTYSYQWKRNNLVIPGAVGKNYILLESDWKTYVSVDVFVENQGTKTLVKTSMALWIGVFLQFSNPKVVISGGELVGDTLSATPQVLEASPVLTYQWLSNGLNIVGATGSTYTLVKADVGKKISVRMKVTKLGWQDLFPTSNEILVYSGVITTAPTPTLILPSKLAIGEVVRGVAGSWGFISSPSYTWICGGGATYGSGPTFTISNSLYGDTCFLRVTGSATGYRPVSRDSASFKISDKAQFKTTQNPAINGTAVVDGQLCVDTGVWDLGAQLSSRWVRDDGAVIASATCVTAKATDVGHSFQVEVTARKFGYEDVKKLSPPSSAIAPGSFKGPLTRGLGIDFVNKKLVVEPTPVSASTSPRITWYRDGKEISGATEFTYVWSEWDQGRVLSHKVVVSKPGYITAEMQSSGYLIPGDKTIICSTPSPGGNWVVGGLLTANVFQLEDGAALSYQWLRNNLPIPGATQRTYRLTKEDEGTSNSLEVTASKAGFVSVIKRSQGVRVSPSTTPVSPSISNSIVSSPIPTIQGIFEVGQELQVLTGQWDSGITLQISWIRNGKPIQSATGRTYRLTSADLGANISVAVTGSKSQVTPVTRISASGQVSAKQISFKPVRPVIVGKAIVGRKVSVDTGIWCSECTYRYQWFSNGTLIRGATSRELLLSKMLVKTRVTVSVSGQSRDGQSGTLTSGALIVSSK